jgi:serine/threonine protein kinase
VLAFREMGDPRRVCSKCGNSYAPDVIFCPKDGTPLSGGKTEVVEDPYVGLMVQGQFRVEQLIGIGAMGRVYRAHQMRIERQVAIKILHRELLRNPAVMGRFHREAKVASRLTHPNVVQVLMTGELERRDPDIGGEAYLVMEYLDGISLRSALAAAGGALPLPRSLHVILQVCDAVGEAHDQGIVHRDLKPENVMLVRRGDDKDFAKVLDFGVARIEWADSTVATQAGAIFGTARYISPEGARGEAVGPASDVYSIATMLFQCLAGGTPFDGESPVAILVKQTSEEPPELRCIPRASYVPEPVARVVADNLAKDPKGRCPNARALGRALVEAARSGGLSPDDLVVRSTLLGNASALQLQSIQRTRALRLSPDLAEQMGAVSRRGGQTQLVGATNRATEAAATEACPTPSAQEKAAERRPGVAPSEPEFEAATEQRAGQQAGFLSTGSSPGDPQPKVEPTLTDEPAEMPVRVSTPASRPAAAQPPVAAPESTRAVAPGSPAVAPNSAEQPRADAGDADWQPPADAVSGRARRIAVTLVCFVFGASLALLAAFRLGVFEQTAPTAQSYLQQAEAALAASAWEQPPGANLREITNAALAQWPSDERILAVRRVASRRLVAQARVLRNREQDEALRLARLAVEFDPDNARAQSLLSTLSIPAQVQVELPTRASTEAPGAQAPGPAPESNRPARRRAPQPRKPAATRPTPSAHQADTPPSAVPPKPATEGRWL